MCGLTLTHSPQQPATMNPSSSSTRRQFLKATGTAAAVSALAGVKIPFVHAAEDNATRVVLVGCGGRGSGAADNALSVTGPPIKLVAMADVFEKRLSSSYETLKGKHGDRVDVPQDRKFIGFDGFKHAMDSINGRCRDLHDAAGVSLGPFRLRDREGPECVYGKAADRGWLERAEDV